VSGDFGIALERRDSILDILRVVARKAGDIKTFNGVEATQLMTSNSVDKNRPKGPVRIGHGTL